MIECGDIYSISIDLLFSQSSCAEPMIAQWFEMLWRHLQVQRGNKKTIYQRSSWYLIPLKMYSWPNVYLNVLTFNIVSNYILYFYILNELFWAYDFFRVRSECQIDSFS